jgi:hypothetical protein
MSYDSMNSSSYLWQLPEHLRSLVENELQEGEEIAWICQPIRKYFAMRSLPMVLFAIPWTGFAIFWIAGASGFKIPNFKHGFDFFPLFGIPFLLIGFGMLSSPFWMAWKAKRTAYVLTDRRAIIFEGGWSANIRSFVPERLLDLQRTQRKDGSGDLIFEKKMSSNSGSSNRVTDIGFLAVPNVKDVEERVRLIVAAVSKPQE